MLSRADRLGWLQEASAAICDEAGALAAQAAAAAVIAAHKAQQ